MPRPELRDSQASYTGLNTTADVTQLAPTEVRQAANVKWTVYGAAQKRNGTQRTHTTALGVRSVQGGYYWESAGVHAVVCDGTLFTAPWGTFPLTWTQQGTTHFFSHHNLISFAAFTSSANSGAEVLYIADGSSIAIWNGSTLTRTAVGSAPSNVAFICVQNKRLFGVTQVDSTLYWSSLASGDDLGVPSTPDAGGNDVIKTFGESACMSLLALAAGLVIFHKRGISVFTGWSQNDISIASGTSGISADTGTICPWAVIAVENNAFFVSDRGIYQLNPLGVVEQISRPIDLTIGSFDHSTFPQVTAAHDKLQRQVMFNFPGEGVYVWNYRTNGWSGPWNGNVYVTIGTTALWAGYDNTNNPIVVGGFADGFVRLCEAPAQYTDDVLANGTPGSSWTTILQPRRLFGLQNEDEFSEKMIRWIYLQAVPPPTGLAAVNWQVGSGSFSATLPNSSGTIWGAFKWGQALWGGFAQTAPYRVQGAGRGKWVDVVIVDNAPSGSLYARIDAVAKDYGSARYGASAAVGAG